MLGSYCEIGGQCVEGNEDGSISTKNHVSIMLCYEKRVV